MATLLPHHGSTVMMLKTGQELRHKMGQNNIFKRHKMGQNEVKSGNKGAKLRQMGQNCGYWRAKMGQNNLQNLPHLKHPDCNVATLWQ